MRTIGTHRYDERVLTVSFFFSLVMCALSFLRGGPSPLDAHGGIFGSAGTGDPPAMVSVKNP